MILSSAPVKITGPCSRYFTTWHASMPLIPFQTIKEEEELLKQMKERNESIRKEVERFLEREKIENAVRAVLPLFGLDQGLTVI